MADPTTVQSVSSQDVPINAFHEHVWRLYTSEFKDKKDMKVWDALHSTFAPDHGSMSEIHAAIQVQIPFAPGVVYTAFQTTSQPTARVGTGHILFFNPFLATSFPCGVYWHDVDLLVRSVAGGNGFDSVSVAPIPPGSPNGNFSAGHFQYGADGAYENGARLAALCILCYLAVRDPSCTIPEAIRRDLAGIQLRYRKALNPEDRAVNCWKETIVKHATSRPMDPIMRFSVLENFGLSSKDASMTAVVKKVNAFFFAQPKCQIDGKELQRMKNIAAMRPDLRSLIAAQIGADGWGEGSPWTGAKFDSPCLHQNRTTRDVSHPEWVHLFTPTERTIRLLIDWNHTQWKSGTCLDAKTFQVMGARLVMAAAVVEGVARPANVGQSLIDDLYHDILAGSHASTLDVVINGELEETFDSSNMRAWAKVKLPFIESLVSPLIAVG